jgi:predicted DNA-binding transcriptional regulator YafY
LAQALYGYNIDRILLWISQGLGDGAPTQLCSVDAFEGPCISKKIDAEILSVISRSIYLRKVVALECLTLEKGVTNREFLPFALADAEYGWVVRGFNRSAGQFMSIDLARISEADIILGDMGEILEEETQAKDILWNRQVELELVPHPKNVQHAETIVKAFNMIDGVLKVWVRAPLAAYTLCRWNVDCSEKHTLRGSEYQLWLRNRQTLYGVTNLSIAPGYETSKKI